MRTRHKDDTREINETIPQRIIGIEPEQHRFKKGTILKHKKITSKGGKRKKWTSQNNHYRLTEAVLALSRIWWARLREVERKVRESIYYQ